MKYAGKLLSEYTLEQLTTISDSLNAAELRREAASQHKKFDTSTSTGMQFPAPNPEFLKLKNTIAELIKSKSVT